MGYLFAMLGPLRGVCEGRRDIRKVGCIYAGRMYLIEFGKCKGPHTIPERVATTFLKWALKKEGSPQ